MKKLISSFLFMLLSVFSFAVNNPGGGSPGGGGPLKPLPTDDNLPKGPIDSNVLILLGVAVILIVAFVMYKRINAKRLA
ncbi:hypothetical protein MWN41_09030 [Ornithobacterium rhinotracheale]|uniref:hypothetical protein n=1 Tax=Ornithobacterium rhinotracheale TaxID=28251 RepID=UPI001FF68BD6|nr:hypothetical protein [Ornithobacterium rhinotracheale]MCK0203152.1 hypothetical protein [Ornithobacterium rhinotracheale]